MTDLLETWRQAFFETVRQHQHATPLRAASLAGQGETWTTALTSVVVDSCTALGWQAAAKGHRLKLLPIRRQEYLSQDVMAFAAGQRGWHFPLAVMELENQQKEEYIAYSLWKVLCVRVELRVVFCYRHDPAQVRPLVRYLQHNVIEAMDIADRMNLTGQTVVVVGSRNEADTFPYGFFKWWQLEKNTGIFERL